MHLLRFPFIAGAALALIISASACGQPAASNVTPAAAPTKAAAAATVAATPTQPAPAPTKPAATPTTAAASPTKPASAGATSLADLTNKAKGNTEYSVSSKISVAGQAISSKTYTKGDKTRQEMTIAGQKTVMLLDQTSKTAYTLLEAQKSAIKLDFSKAVSDIENPTENVASLPKDAKFIGNETLDGKSASVFEVTTTEGTGKIWIWTERGLPLKVENPAAGGKAIIEFTDYQFGPQPDSLFVLPEGTQILDIPMPNLPGNIPVPGR